MQYTVTITFPTQDELHLYSVLDRQFETVEAAREYYDALEPFLEYGILQLEESDGNGNLTVLAERINEATLEEFPKLEGALFNGTMVQLLS